MATQRRNFRPPFPSPQPPAPLGFTLVEMLVAMAITLVMMAAVVTLFANVSNSVRNRRATIEMSGQLRHLRNVLQQDLQGATCPGLPWQRPESNHGYIEIVEGQYREGNAGNLLDADPDNPGNPPTWPPLLENPEIDHKLSTIPSSNMPFADAPGKANWITDGAGLGDYDDVLMLTVRNEHEPFIGRSPTNVRRDADEANRFDEWQYGTIESTLAEVVWYSIENPGYTDDPEDTADDPPGGGSDPSAKAFFGEPGMRTIYRRTLLIAPWINPYRFVDRNGNNRDTFSLARENIKFQARPGLVRVLSEDIKREDLARALASLVAFQERYDLSVRLEFDPNLDPPDGRYVILANTLADLTKRENRYEHHFFRPGDTPAREYPYAALSMGSRYTGTTPTVVCWPELESPNVPPPFDFPLKSNEEGRAHLQNLGGLRDVVVAYSLRIPFPPPNPDDDSKRQRYKWRPFAYVEEESDKLATARVMLNDEYQVVRIVHGMVPLSGERRGEDVMMTGVLAFDLRVYDPGAPLFRHLATDTVLQPSDPAWRGLPTNPPTIGAYIHDDNMKLDGSGAIGTDDTTFPFVGQGAYVDLGYGYDVRWGANAALTPPKYTANFATSADPWFFAARGLTDVLGQTLAPGYAVYDTWSFHYENNGVNEDGDEVEPNAAGLPVWQLDDFDGQGQALIDEGTNGFDDWGHYPDGNFIRLGVDDVGERETAPPYDKPLRGVQVLVRSYESDSRAIRQVRVNQHFMAE